MIEADGVLLRMMLWACGALPEICEVKAKLAGAAAIAGAANTVIVTGIVMELLDAPGVVMDNEAG